MFKASFCHVEAEPQAGSVCSGWLIWSSNPSCLQLPWPCHHHLFGRWTQRLHFGNQSWGCSFRTHQCISDKQLKFCWRNVRARSEEALLLSDRFWHQIIPDPGWSKNSYILISREASFDSENFNIWCIVRWHPVIFCCPLQQRKFLEWVTFRNFVARFL